MSIVTDNCELSRLAQLIRARNQVEEEISKITGRPASLGHLGEYIAARIFDIELAPSANHKSIDGWFRSGPLLSKSVNVKWYAYQESILDMCVEDPPDFYLVLTGAKNLAGRAIGPRPWSIESVFIFPDAELRSLLTCKIGVATSLKQEHWQRWQVFPLRGEGGVKVNELQRNQLRMFAAS